MRQFFVSLFFAAFAFTSVAAHQNTKSMSDCVPSLDNLITVTGSAGCHVEQSQSQNQRFRQAGSSNSFEPSDCLYLGHLKST
jgi:hypothetical protein